ncbi:benzaldehyde dehydrogenase [Marinobacterium iners]|uniref:aldehyde dehydrogenase family protein n=1 Tax=Marinobacterium iners TaxID=48076 RepID=UPI001A8E6B7E|nr:aldehyde dehydrogenase family protein [Marinobacterium iners]QSR35326.1 benzaldehyde dehydrogenase [Marinobacterium iners]
MNFNISDYSNKFFDGRWCDSTGEVADILEPATGNALGKIVLTTAIDVDKAVSSSKAAQGKWAATPFNQRADCLRKVAEVMRENAELFIEWNIRECGSIRPKAEWELQAAIEQLNASAALTMYPDGATYPSSVPGRRNIVRHVALGVIGVIAPWNFPLLLAMRSVAPAIALGNAVVLKPDHQSAVTGGLLMARAFEEAGLPAGVFSVVPGDVIAGEALVENESVAMISFTGSTPVGKKIGSKCGGRLKKAALELGGNNAFIVLADADLDAAASNGAWGSFLHQGQICMQAGRHFVHESVADEYIQKLAERARKLRIGDPYRQEVEIGPLINEAQYRRVDGIVQESLQQGARLITGGKGERLFYEPTILANVDVSNRACAEELFGPVVPVVTFKDEDHLVEQVLRSDYGLAAAIHTQNYGVAFSLADRLKAGMVHINDQTVNNEFHVPFGGMGDSGNGGRFGGLANIEEFTEVQWVSFTEKPIIYPF